MPSIFFAWESGPSPVRGMAVSGGGGGGFAVGLPRWDGRDYNLIPSSNIEVYYKLHQIPEIRNRYVYIHDFGTPGRCKTVVNVRASVPTRCYGACDY